MAEQQYVDGIINPPIDELLKRVDSKFGLVIFASKRARQINDYYTQLHEGSLFNNVGPLVESTVDDKPLTVALREIAADKLVLTPGTEVEARRAAEAAAQVDADADAAEAEGAELPDEATDVTSTDTAATDTTADDAPAAAAGDAE